MDMMVTLAAADKQMSNCRGCGEPLHALHSSRADGSCCCISLGILQPVRAPAPQSLAPATCLELIACWP